MQFKCNEKINQVTENTLVVGMDIAITIKGNEDSDLDLVLK